EDPARLFLDLDKSNPERLLRLYFGGYVAPGGGDPFAAGLLDRIDGRFYVHVDSLDMKHPGMGAALREEATEERLDWDALEAFFNATYYAARNLPPTLDDLQAEVPYRDEEEAWFHVELDGVMSTARRHVYVAESALRRVLRAYHQNGERLIYPEGTAIVGENHLDGEHIETVAIRKREDGFWDFFAYAKDGRLTHSTQPLPRAHRSPTQCVGCHLGSKLFEPERSFPGHASPGPHGPRAFYVDDAWRDREAAVFFDEHRKRSDTVLGIYNTLFVARLRAERRASRLSSDDEELLNRLGL
ncbi:MAG: hypothetical protein ACE5G0_23295, partial [Rhodothermales bacterium]